MAGSSSCGCEQEWNVNLGFEQLSTWAAWFGYQTSGLAVSQKQRRNIQLGTSIWTDIELLISAQTCLHDDVSNSNANTNGEGSVGKNVDLSIVTRLTFDRLAMVFDTRCTVHPDAMERRRFKKCHPPQPGRSWKMGSGLETPRMLAAIKRHSFFGQAHGWKLKSFT